MKTETNFGVYGREFEGALARWEGDPRSAIGGNAIGKATSTNEGGWVPPRDIGYTIPKVEQVEDNFSIVTNSVHFGPVVNPVEPAPDSAPAVVQRVKRADGTTTIIRMPR